jgi:hypothetical protein
MTDDSSAMPMTRKVIRYALGHMCAETFASDFELGFGVRKLWSSL